MVGYLVRRYQIRCNECRKQLHRGYGSSDIITLLTVMQDKECKEKQRYDTQL